jgi:hypothetical protein
VLIHLLTRLGYYSKMTNEIDVLIERLSGQLSPIRDLARRRLAAGGTVDFKSKALLIDHRPKAAAEAYALVLHPGISPSDIDRYVTIQRVVERPIFEIPEGYLSVLTLLNGAEIFRASFFGIPRSTLGNPPLLDRSTRQPLDLGSANSRWRLKYKVNSSLFLFGSGPHSHTENLGYFWDRAGRIETVLAEGRKLESYATLEDFLRNELARLESTYAEYEEREEELRRHLATNQSASRKSK